MTYNSRVGDNRVTNIGSVTSVYDYAGHRVKKNGTVYIGKLYECLGTTCTKYIFAGSSRIASKSSSYTYYYHTDHLGSSNVITDIAGNKAQETYYYPFGETRYDSGSATHYKFTGQEEDAETGLYYYGARYYDPVIGRFISPDSIVPNPGDPQALNRYTYCRNNPLIYIDPNGHSFLSSLFSTVVGVAFTLVGQPFIGALLSSAINTAANGGNIGDFAIGLGVGIVAGFAGGSMAGGIAKEMGMNAAGLGTALLRGGLSGAIAGAGTAAIYGGNIGAGALGGAIGGMATAGIVWGVRAYQTEQFIKDNVKLSSEYSASEKATVLQSIKDAGQSPSGQRMMSAFRDSGSTLEMWPDSLTGRGPMVVGGTNWMFFSGNIQGNYGSSFASYAWGPSLNDATAFVHEGGHTLSGGLNVRDPLNVSLSENLYRSWIGSPPRTDYYVPNDVPSRPMLDVLWRTW